MDHLSPLDASFLDLEDQDPHVSLAIASVAVIDGPAPTQEAIVEAIRGRLPLVPRYRQRVQRVPFDIGRPVWVDDPAIDLDYHLRRTALPAPADDASLCRVIARVMSQRLDRERPLWEAWVIEGLADGRWALLSKVHHCMVDGVSGNELYRLIFDATPEPGGPVADTWEPQAEPDQAALVADALSDLVAATVGQARVLVDSLRRPEILAKRIGDTLRGLATVARAVRPVTSSSLVGSIGRSRRYSAVRTPLAEIRQTAEALGVTINDVVLAAVAGALRTVLAADGEVLAPDAVRALVPVNVRTARDAGVLDNRLSMLLPMLPVDRDDPLDRVRAVHERIGVLRHDHESEAVAIVTTIARYEPYLPISMAIKTALRMPQRILATVVTNVPGPKIPLYVLGRRIREILPYVPIAMGMRVGVSVFTYEGQAVIGITADFEHFPHPDHLAEAVHEELTTLARATLGTAAATAPHRKARRVGPEHQTTKARGGTTPALRQGRAKAAR